MDKPELLINVKSAQEIELLATAGVCAFVIGDVRFALMARGSFQKKGLEEAVELAHALEKKVYLLIDAIFSSEVLIELERYLYDIKYIQFDAVRVADIGVYMLVTKIMPKMPIHFVDAMMLTNYVTVNYWANKGITRVRLAHELTLDEVLEIKQLSTCEIEVLIQGASLMFTSRRKLVDNYLDFQRMIKKQVSIIKKGNYLYDKERELYYPIIQNDHGTHIYGGNDVCMVDDLARLISVGIDVLYIESFTYKTQDLVKIVNLYRVAIDLFINSKKRYREMGRALYAEVDKLQPANRQMDRGFYYKPTIYKNKINKPKKWRD